MREHPTNVSFSALSSSSTTSSASTSVPAVKKMKTEVKEISKEEIRNVISQHGGISPNELNRYFKINAQNRDYFIGLLKEVAIITIEPNNKKKTLTLK